MLVLIHGNWLVAYQCGPTNVVALVTTNILLPVYNLVSSDSPVHFRFLWRMVVVAVTVVVHAHVIA